MVPGEKAISSVTRLLSTPESLETPARRSCLVRLQAPGDEEHLCILLAPQHAAVTA